MRLFLVSLILASSVPTIAQIAPRHVPPSDRTVPVGARLLIQVIGEGTQNYTCIVNAGAFAWKFEAPDAQLLDPATHAQLGTHSSGPTWRWNDGSAVTGKVRVTQTALAPGSVPWLLLTASPEGTRKGILSPVVWVRRSETRGGVAPQAGCEAARIGEKVAVPYKALYTFYSADTPTR